MLQKRLVKLLRGGLGEGCDVAREAHAPRLVRVLVVRGGQVARVPHGADHQALNDREGGQLDHVPVIGEQATLGPAAHIDRLEAEARQSRLGRPGELSVTWSAQRHRRLARVGTVQHVVLGPVCQPHPSGIGLLVALHADEQVERRLGPFSHVPLHARLGHPYAAAGARPSVVHPLAQLGLIQLGLLPAVLKVGRSLLHLVQHVLRPVAPGGAAALSAVLEVRVDVAGGLALASRLAHHLRNLSSCFPSLKFPLYSRSPMGFQCFIRHFSKSPSMLPPVLHPFSDRFFVRHISPPGLVLCRIPGLLGGLVLLGQISPPGLVLRRILGMYSSPFLVGQISPPGLVLCCIPGLFGSLVLLGQIGTPAPACCCRTFVARTAACFSGGARLRSALFRRVCCSFFLTEA